MHDRDESQLVAEVGALRATFMATRDTLEELKHVLRETVKALSDGRVKFVQIEASIDSLRLKLDHLDRELGTRIKALEVANEKAQKANERTTRDVKKILLTVLSRLAYLAAASGGTLLAEHHLW